MTIAIYQGFHGEKVPREIINEVKSRGASILALPEYYLYGSDYDSILPNHQFFIEHLEYLRGLSREACCAVTGATLLFRSGANFFNRCYFINEGETLGYYDKIHLYKNEGGGQVIPGKTYTVIDYLGLKIGLLVCADVLYRESYEKMAELKPNLIIIPVTSPYRAADTTEAKKWRDNELFLEGARITSCPVIKVSSVGCIAGHKVQGRSLIATTEKIIFRTPYEREDEPLLKIETLQIN